MVGKTLSHYEIVEKLGEGGMGEVYLARDLRLGRTVALKVLPAEFARDEGRRQRLQREARAASALKHPNITHIYDVGEAEGACFIAMEYVEGESLRSRLDLGPLATTDILDLGIQLADALAEAHAHGLIHRDIKPANIMLTQPARGGGAHVKVLDFGLVKATPSAAPAADAEAPTQTATQPGLVVGTFPYMSPEQALGKEVDARSDLFSLGVVLYEMAAGRRPFEGRTPAETLTKIASAEPAPLAQSGAAVPEQLERVVRKCLEKDPERRYQSAREILVDLRNLKRDTESGAAAVAPPAKAASRLWLYAVGALVLVVAALLAVRYLTGPAGGPLTSVAVLPFENSSGDKESEYLCDALTENLINTLAQLPEVKVISWLSVRRFKAGQKDPQAIARQLAVQAVVAGRVLHRQDRLQVSAELVDVRDQRQLWGGRYDRRFADVMDIESDLAQTIGSRLRLRLSREQAHRLSRRLADDPEAYRLYLRGRAITVGTRAQIEQAHEYYRRALEVQPDLALAHVGLAEVYSYEALHAMRGPQDARAKITAAMRRALEINPDLAEAHVAAALVKIMFDWDWAGAESETRMAVELGPGNAEIHRNRSYYFLALGRFEEAAAACSKAQEFDPLSTRAYHDRALALMGKRDYDGAIADFQRALELNPNWTWGYIKMGVAYTRKRMCAEALAAAAKAEARIKGSYTPLSVSWLGHVYAACGDLNRAHEALRRLDESAKTMPVDPTAFATVYSGLVDKERTLKLLAETVAGRWPQAFLLKAWPGLFYPGLESEPRFQALLKQMSLP